jgi:hypothetical protein
VIGVHVRIDHVPNAHAMVGSRPDVQIDVLDGIHDGTNAVATATEQIRRRHGIEVEELPEDHARTPERFTPMTPNLRAVDSFDVPRKES